MFSNRHEESVNEHKTVFLNNHPFHHIVLDDFIQGPIQNIVNEIQSIPNSEYDFNEHAQVQIKKRGLSVIDKLPDLTKRLVHFFQSPLMIQYLERLTGITGLMADPTLLGGGVHKTETGGHLAVHADFNIHPETGFHRRLNLLLFLNPIWNSDWGGFLELWDTDMKNKEKEIAPLLNRAVIFRITDDAFHGHPDPLRTPPGVARYSLAFYYYTKDRPDHEKSAFHWATWQLRPDGRF
jgi:hypothetical protein